MKKAKSKRSEFWDHIKTTADKVRQWPEWKKGESISTLKNVMIPKKNQVMRKTLKTSIDIAPPIISMYTIRK